MQLICTKYLCKLFQVAKISVSTVVIYATIIKKIYSNENSALFDEQIKHTTNYLYSSFKSSYFFHSIGYFHMQNIFYNNTHYNNNTCPSNVQKINPPLIVVMYMYYWVWRRVKEGIISVN